MASVKRKDASIDSQESDSDEEVPSNTIGSNVPLKWYENHDHIGYDLEAKKILKPVSSGKIDEIDDFLEKMENADYWRTVYDDLTGQRVTLTNEDIDVIQRIRNAQTHPDDNVYEPWVDTFSSEVMVHPILNTPESKASFVPSKWERLKVGKYLHAIKMGWVKPAPPKEDPLLFNNYDIWADEPKTNLPRSNIPAPKLELPGHAESYNPPSEYLLDDAEVEALKAKMESDYDENERQTKTLFVPKKYSSLRQVPAYDQFVHERFQRCLDLYLCPRQKRLKANITDLNDLIPDKPKPQDLHPYPLVQSLIYEGHTSIIRCLTVHPSGQWLASGSDDCTVRIWEIITTRCMNVFKFDQPVVSLQWNPILSLLTVATGSKVVMINPKLGEQAKVLFTDEFIKQLSYESSTNDDCQWSKTSEESDKYIRLTIEHSIPVRQIEWQGRGDYLACVLIPRSDQSQSKSILIHHVSKGRSQYPFKQLKGAVQHVRFHPSKPIFIIATQHSIKIYHLLKQQLIKRLYVNTKWISSIDVHPLGDNILCGGYDSKINWFDLDLSVKPYETYRYHKRAVRCVRYHPKLPLFASTSDDGTCIVSHCSVYADLLKNPLIVPVKILRGHQIINDLSMLDCLFHPIQPWIFTSGADGTIRLFTN